MGFQAGVPGVGLCLYLSRDLQCCSKKGWFLGWTEFLVHPCCSGCCRCGHGVNICLNPLYPKGPWKRTLSWPTLFVKLQPLHIPMRRDFSNNHILKIRICEKRRAPKHIFYSEAMKTVQKLLHCLCETLGHLWLKKHVTKPCFSVS